MAKELKSICFVAPMAWSVLAQDRSVPVVGGAEVQQAYLARELAERGHQVSMICLDYGQPDGVVVGGVKVFKMHAPGAGWPVLRFLHPGLSSVWRAMRMADAQIYYQRAASSLTAFVVAFAKRHQRHSIFSAAGDLDFTPGLPAIRYARDRWLYRWAVPRADRVVVQTLRQRHACESFFGVKALQVNSCHPKQENSGNPGGPIIWVGAIKEVKQPELFIELARRMPEYEFTMVGGPASALKSLPKPTSNLTQLGFVPHADVGKIFDGSAVLVNTSVSEGFPNTFLQAWARGVPTLSFFDPQIEPRGSTFSEVALTVDDMEKHLRRWKSDAQQWSEASAAAGEYLRLRHSISSVVDVYESLFLMLGEKQRNKGLSSA